MTCPKSILFSALLVAAVSVINAVPGLKSDAHNIYLCPHPSLAQEIIFEITIHQVGELDQILYENIAFPSSRNNNSMIITCVKIFDLNVDGNGGYPVLTNGGLGQYEITVNLSSQLNQGLDFRIIVWTGTATTANSF